jgi:hypothetical protein
MAKQVGPVPIHEAMRILANDADYQARVAKTAVESAARQDARNQAERPLALELQAAGYPVDTAWDLYKHKPYTSALPILVDHLSRDYPDRVREGIARRLAVKEARPWASSIQAYYAAATEPDAKLGLAAAVAATLTRDTIESYIELLKDPGNGKSRILMVRALNRQRDPRAKAAIDELATDPQLSVEISRARRGISPNA